MKVESERSLTRPIKRIVVVDDGSTFHDLINEKFYWPLVDALQKRLSDLGIESRSVTLDKKALNPGDAISKSLQESGARHVLFVQLTRVRSSDPNKASALLSGVFISEYSLSFVIRDAGIEKNIWKANVEAGRGHTGSKQEIEEIMDKLEVELLIAGLAVPPYKKRPD